MVKFSQSKFSKKDSGKSDKKKSSRFDKSDSDRFEKRDSGRTGGRSSGRFERRDSGRSNRDFEQREMHEVTCDKCGKRCEVPFKPTASKPVYCDDCFRKNGNSGSRNDRSAKEFDQINEKLDKILKALNVN